MRTVSSWTKTTSSKKASIMKRIKLGLSWAVSRYRQVMDLPPETITLSGMRPWLFCALISAGFLTLIYGI